MSLPNVVTLSLAASSTQIVVNQAPIQGPGKLPLTANPVVLDTQRRLLLTTSGNETANTFTVVGLNGAGFPTVEVMTGVSSSTAQSNLDFKTVISVSALATTAATVSFGTDGVGSSLWQIMNWHATPVNIAVSGVVVSTSTAVNYGFQYTYDDPNNLPPGVQFAQPFNHPTVTATTVTLDGAINDPVTAVRLIVNSGTGIVRGTIIQAGLGSP